MPLLIAGLTDSKALVSGLEVARGLPVALLRPARRRRRGSRPTGARVMAVVDAGRCVAVGILAIAIWQDQTTVGLIWVVAFLLGSGEVFFDNSAQSILPEPRRRATHRAGQRPLLRHRVGGARPAGPGDRRRPLRDGRVAAVRDRFVLVPRGVTVDLHPCGYLPRTAAAPNEARRFQQRRSGPTIRDDLREGWTWLKRNPLLRSLVVVGCTYNFLVVGAEALNVLFVRDILHASKAVFGLVLTVSAVGGIGAGLAAERVIKKLGSGTTIIATLALAGVAGLAAGTTNNVIVFALAMALAITCGTTANIVVLSLRQTLVPDELRGRVNSIYRVSDRDRSAARRAGRRPARRARQPAHAVADDGRGHLAPLRGRHPRGEQRRHRQSTQHARVTKG